VSESNLEQLMYAYVHGDASAFNHIYRRASPSVFSYLLRLTRTQSQAEDLLQVTFAKAHKARSSYIPGAPLIPWLLAIARRAFLDEVRMKKGHFEDLSRDGVLPEQQRVSPATSEELSDALARALDALPENYRDAIHLTKITGLSLAEAADVLETTSCAVKLRVHRGYNLMRDQLGTLQTASP